MNDLQYAKAHLGEHSVCLSGGGQVIISDERGVAPLIKLIDDRTDLTGYSAADKIVGKAAAMLFYKAGIVAIFGKTMSESAKEFLEDHGIDYEYETLVTKIINRQGTDICPMEKTVLNISDADEGYAALKDKLYRLKNSTTV